MKICRFNEFTPLNEKMGVALPAVCYAEPIHNLTISEFSKFLDSDSKKSNLKFEITSDNFSDCISNKESYKKIEFMLWSIDDILELHNNIQL